MPNVDTCIRYAEIGLCKDTTEYSNLIYNLNEKNKVNIFKNKAQKEIEEILLNCSKTIKNYIINNFYKTNNFNEEIILINESNNNKIGADLKHILPNNKTISIEVKFGEQTDKNIGMDKFNKIFSCDIFSKILSTQQRKGWIKLYFDDENESKQFERLYQSLNEGIQIFNDFNKSKNWTLTKEEQNYMESEIINISGNGLYKYDYYLKFILNGNNFSSFSHITTGVGNWIIQQVKFLDDKTKRVSVFIDNYDTNIEIKFVLNWKNNYNYFNKTAKAKLGLGSPSWNIWIDVEIKKIKL